MTDTPHVTDPTEPTASGPIEAAVDPQDAAAEAISEHAADVPEPTADQTSAAPAAEAVDAAAAAPVAASVEAESAEARPNAAAEAVEDAARALDGPAADSGEALAAAIATVEPAEAVPVETVVPSPAPHRRRRRVGLFAIAFVLGLAVVIGASGAGLAAWDAGYALRVLPGVHVGSVDLSGLDRAGAAAALQAAYPYGQGEVVLRTPGGDISVPYSAFGRRADVDALVDAAMTSGRGGDLAHRVVSQLGQAVHGVSLTPHVLLDQRALAAAVTAALTPLATNPVDATISMSAGSLVTTPARDGSAVDPAPAIAAALAAVQPADAPARVVVPVATTPIAPTVTDSAVRIAIYNAGVVSRGGVKVAFGKTSWTIRESTIRTWLGFAVAADGSIAPTIDATKIPRSLKSVAKAVLSPARSAVFLHAKSGRIFGVAASADGKQLDLAATSQRIADSLLARMSSSAAAAVKVAVAPLPPKLTTEQAKQKAPVMTMLGTWTTWFPISDHNFFGANIWIPARTINGTVLGAGQTFDWWNSVGDVTPSRGFGPGGVIRGNHTDPTGALGGGMCSSSTTLFNAALRAGLTMGARGNHRYYINRYPLGLDATVWKMGGAVQDMSFTNDTGHPILILGIKTVGSGGRGYVTYQLWGTPDGRTVSLSAPSVSNVVKATTNTQTVGTLPHGVRQQTEFPSNEMDVAVTRVVRDKNGRVVHAEVWRSHYVLWNGIIQIGR